MDWQRIIGQLIEGYGAKAIAIVFALILAHTVLTNLAAMVAPISGVLK
jgi:hypothetical protein